MKKILLVLAISTPTLYASTAAEPTNQQEDLTSTMQLLEVHQYLCKFPEDACAYCLDLREVLLQKLVKKAHPLNGQPNGQHNQLERKLAAIREQKAQLAS